MSQTIAAGSLPKYGNLPGFTATPMIMPMERIFGLLCGPPGEGKTTFIQSCETGFVFNLDKSSTSPFVKGTVWPGIDDTGQPCDQNGKVFLSWDLMIQMRDTLIGLAIADQPRPSTIFVDTIDALIPLIMGHLIKVNNVTYWQEMDGRRMWAILYDMIVKWCNDLREAGYGVWLVCHVVNKKIPIGDDRFAIKPELTIGEGLWKRTEWAYEMIAGIEKTTIQTQRTVKQKAIKRAGGESFQPDDKIVTEEKTAWVFTVDSTDYPELTKKRIALPSDINLDPARDGWKVVKDVYDGVIANPATY